MCARRYEYNSVFRLQELELLEVHDRLLHFGEKSVLGDALLLFPLENLLKFIAHNYCWLKFFGYSEYRVYASIQLFLVSKFTLNIAGR